MLSLDWALLGYSPGLSKGSGKLPNPVSTLCSLSLPSICPSLWEVPSALNDLRTGAYTYFNISILNLSLDYKRCKPFGIGTLYFLTLYSQPLAQYLTHSMFSVNAYGMYGKYFKATFVTDSVGVHGAFLGAHVLENKGLRRDLKVGEVF